MRTDTLVKYLYLYFQRLNMWCNICASRCPKLDLSYMVMVVTVFKGTACHICGSQKLMKSTNVTKHNVNKCFEKWLHQWTFSVSPAIFFISYGDCLTMKSATPMMPHYWLWFCSDWAGEMTSCVFKLNIGIFIDCEWLFMRYKEYMCL